MKKRIGLVAMCICTCMFLLSGCVRYSTTVEVKPDGKADVSIIVATAQDTSMNDEGGMNGDVTQNEDGTISYEGSWDFSGEWSDEATDDEEEAVLEDQDAAEATTGEENYDASDPGDALEENADDTDALEAESGDLDVEAVKKEAEENGWEYEDYDKDNYKGYILTKRDVDLENLSEAVANKDMASSFPTDKFTVKKNGSKYTLLWDLHETYSDEETTQGFDYLASSGGYAKFVLKLPKEPISTNAQEISDDGKTLTWNLVNLGEDRTVEATFQLKNWGPYIGLIAIAGLAVILGVVSVILRRRNAGFEE